MIKNTLITFFMLILLSTNSYSAGTSSGSDSNSANNYSKAVKLVKAAKKFENDDDDALVLLCEVHNPERFGIADVKDNKNIKITTFKTFSDLENEDF